MSTPALDALKLEHPQQLFIGGQWREPSTRQRLQLVNPATEQAFFEVAEAGIEDMNTAVSAARSAFDEGPWPRLKPAERAQYLRELGKALDKRIAALDSAWTLQIGVPVMFSTGASAGAGMLLNYYADLAERYAFEDARPSGGYMSKAAIVVREPVGVVAAITPWNGPLMSMIMKLAPALAAGCTVICKPSPETPLEMFLLAEAAQEARLPAGVINLLPAGREVSDQLIRHEGVDKVAFTGSTQAGLHIASVCASRMARYTMELGGKSAAIVLDDFDPAQLGPALAPLVTQLCGQVCINYSRVLVPRRRYASYVDSLASAMAQITVGDPLDKNTYMGPLAMKRQLDRVNGYIEQGVAEGARLATGGKRPAHLESGYYLQPTVFSDATNDMTIAREEIFGPVTAVIPYDSEDEAVRLSNQSEYGLSGGVFTQDTDRAYAIARCIRTGHFTQNGREFDLSNPFGGFKKSGFGREGGPEGIEPYLETKTVFLPGKPSHL